MFFENSFARMYGPHFLIFYGILIVCIIFFITNIIPKLVSRKRQGSDSFTIPAQPDPYEIAYLRGGEREIIILGVFSLISRGYLSILTNDHKSDVWIGQKKITPALYLLNNYETALFGLLDSKERPVKQIFNTEKALEVVKASCDAVKEKLDKEELIWGEREQNQFKLYKSLSIGIIILVGLYKMIASKLHGHTNVMFMVILAVIGCAIISKIKINELSSGRGQEYLEQLKSVFRPNKDLDIIKQPLYMQQLQLAIFGIMLLEGTKLAYLANYFKSKFFKRNNISWEGFEFSNSSGGSSCGSGSSCGGGCGSSCGGGCGGCS